MIAKFIQDNGLHKDEDIEKIRDCVYKHLMFGTLVTLYDKKGLYAVTLFNVDGKVAIILDTVVRKDKRSPQVLKDMIKEGLLRFPKCKYLKFERALKNKPMHLVNINKFLKEKH